MIERDDLTELIPYGKAYQVDSTKPGYMEGLAGQDIHGRELFGVAVDQVYITVGNYRYYFDYHGEFVHAEAIGHGKIVPFGAYPPTDRAKAENIFKTYQSWLQDLMSSLATTRTIEGLGIKSKFGGGRCALTGKTVVVGDYISQWDDPQGWALTTYAVFRPDLQGRYWGTGRWDTSDYDKDQIEWIERLRVVMREKA